MNLSVCYFYRNFFIKHRVLTTYRAFPLRVFKYLEKLLELHFHAPELALLGLSGFTIRAKSQHQVKVDSNRNHHSDHHRARVGKVPVRGTRKSMLKL